MSFKGEFANLFNLDGRIAVVTGGAGILGSRFCRSLAGYGAKVLLVERTRELAEQGAASMRSEGYENVVPFGCDVSDETDVRRLRAEVEERFRRVDILVNNAASKGSDIKKCFEETATYSMDTWREISTVNLDGVFLVAREFGSWMATRGSGSIIQLGSIYGVVAPDQRIYEGSNYLGVQINTPAVYSATKAAVVGLTKYFASLWGAQGVRVNTLVPGGVESGQNSVFVQNYSRRVPMNRMAKANEMVGALLFLASDASSYVTGQTIIVDGGLTCW